MASIPSFYLDCVVAVGTKDLGNNVYVLSFPMGLVGGERNNSFVKFIKINQTVVPWQNWSQMSV